MKRDASQMPYVDWLDDKLANPQPGRMAITENMATKLYNLNHALPVVEGEFILTVGAVTARTEAECLMVEGLGYKTLRTLRSLLEEDGLTFCWTSPPKLPPVALALFVALDRLERWARYEADPEDESGRLIENARAALQSARNAAGKRKPSRWRRST